MAMAYLPKMLIVAPAARSKARCTNDDQRAERQHALAVEQGLAQHERQRQERGDDGQLAHLDAQVETHQRQHQRTLRQAQVGQHRREAEAVQQAEAEGHHPAPPLDRAAQVVERGDHHRERDGRFHQPRRQADHLQRRQAERDRVGQREGRHHLHHFLERPREARRAFPSAGAPHQHRRQQQRQQEQDVVVADPDVPDAIHQVLAQRVPAAGRLHGQVLLGRVGAEDQRLRRRAARRDPLHQAAVRRIDVEEQRIAQLQAGVQAGAAGDEAEHGIGAVAVVIELDGRRGFPRAVLVAGRQLQVLGRHPRDVGAALAHLAPGQLAVGVAIELQHVVEVAQGDVPARHDVAFAGFGAQREVAVARFVGPGERRQQQARQQGDPALHRFAPCAASWSARCAMRGSS
jgi:hypothetical protein